MRKILLSFLFLSTISNAQIKLERTRSGSFSQLSDSKGSYLLKNGGSYDSYTVNDIEIWKTEKIGSTSVIRFTPQINENITNPRFMVLPRIPINLTKHIFNDDDKLEILVFVGTYNSNSPASLVIYNEDGEIIKNFGRKFSPTVLNSDQFVETVDLYFDEFTQSLKLKLYSRIDDKSEIYDLGNNTLSIEEFERITNSKVFPNPSSDYINITNPKNGNDIVQIYDVSGRLLKNEKVNPNDDNFRINIQNLSKGNYVIKIGEVSSKFIKN